MNRLTKKFNGEYYYKDATTIMFNSEIDYNVVQKLGKLEDLAEELGCSLEVFVGIMLKKIDKIVVNYGDAEGYKPLYCEYTETIVSGIIEVNDKLFVETNLCDIPLNDYGKEWWLKGEKSNE